AGYFLPAPLARFRRLFPGIEPRLFELDRAEIERGLVEGGIDLAVMLVSNLRDGAHIDTETLIQSKRRLWLPVGHRLLQLRQVTLADIAPEPFIMLTIDEAEKTALRYWKRSRLRPSIAFRTSSVEAVRSLVATGAGVAVLSDMVYRPWSLEGDRIEARSLAEPVPSMDVGLAWRRDAKLAPPAQAFLDFCHMTYNAAGAEIR
ncbi:MAG: LysR substrate-binding domain-containing protein, partial [Dongiaceae bacterium]